MSLCLPWEPLKSLNLGWLSANWAQVSHTLSNWLLGGARRPTGSPSCHRVRVSCLETEVQAHSRVPDRRCLGCTHASTGGTCGGGSAGVAMLPWHHGTGGSLSHRLHLTQNRGAHITHCHLTAPVLSFYVITRLISHSLWLYLKDTLTSPPCWWKVGRGCTSTWTFLELHGKTVFATFS